MTYERLTERQDDGTVKYLGGDNDTLATAYEKLKYRLCNLEEKIKSGQAVILQAKVGDWVYGCAKDLKRVIFGKVYKINIDDYRGLYYTVYENDKIEYFLDFVYKTEDEVEAKLKELRGE